MLYLMCSPADLIATLVHRRFFFNTKSCVSLVSARCFRLRRPVRAFPRRNESNDELVMPRCKAAAGLQLSHNLVQRPLADLQMEGCSLDSLISFCHVVNINTTLSWSYTGLGALLATNASPLILFARVGGTRDGLDCTSLRDACK